MKKQASQAPKLSFNKEKVASLTPEDLDQIHGGVTAPSSDNSSNHNFTCCFCSSRGLTDIPVSE